MVSQHRFYLCMHIADSDLSKGGNGLLKSYGTNHGKIYIHCGGSAVRNATDWQQKNTS